MTPVSHSDDVFVEFNCILAHIVPHTALPEGDDESLYVLDELPQRFCREYVPSLFLVQFPQSYVCLALLLTRDLPRTDSVSRDVHSDPLERARGPGDQSRPRFRGVQELDPLPLLVGDLAVVHGRVRALTLEGVEDERPVVEFDHQMRDG